MLTVQQLFRRLVTNCLLNDHHIE